MLKLLGFFLLTAGIVMLFRVIYTGQLIWLVAFLAFFFLGITFLFVERVEEITFRGLGTIKLGRYVRHRIRYSLSFRKIQLGCGSTLARREKIPSCRLWHSWIATATPKMVAKRALALFI
jgi:hypothetical protein